MKKPDDSERILRELNKHKGIDKAIIAAELAVGAGFKERKTRQIISDIVKEQGLLIASRVQDPCGFYLIKKASELRECLGQYKSRIDRLDDRASSLSRAGAKRFGKASLRGFKFNGYPKSDLPVNKKRSSI